MICGARQTAVQSWVERSAGPRSGRRAISNGSQLIRPAALGTASNTRQTTGINCDGSFFVEFQRSTDGGVTWQTPIEIPNEPIYGTLDVDSNGNVFVGGEGTPFTVCARAMRRSEARRLTFDQSHAGQHGWRLGWWRNQPRRTDGRLFWRWIAPEGRLTITFTCWRA